MLESGQGLLGRVLETRGHGGLLEVGVVVLLLQTFHVINTLAAGVTDFLLTVLELGFNCRQIDFGFCIFEHT